MISSADCDADRTVVGSFYLIEDKRAGQLASQSLRNEYVIYTPAHVTLTGFETRTPPAIPDSIGVQGTKSVDKSCAEELGKAVNLPLGIASRLVVV